MAKPDRFAETRIIIAEGYDDAIFVDQLIRTPARHLPRFDIWANVELGSIGGNTGFTRSIMAADIKRDFHLVTDVLILADNEQTPTTSFRSICDQIRNARQNGNLKRDWAIPTQPASKEVGDPSVSVWMFPSAGAPGCLETLLWQAIENQGGHTANVACVNAACHCSGADQWPNKSKLAKAKVRCFLSLVCKDNPAVGFNDLWRDFPHLIPMNQAAFTPIADFLRSI
jgi:hypothetical protein